MGRISTTSNANSGVIEKPEYTVVVWDPKREKRITPTSNNELIPTKIQNRGFGAGSYGGTAELVHTGLAFSQYNNSDTDILIGAYVQILDGRETLFVGTITQVQLEASAETNQITYLCRDLWHAISDHSLYVDLVGGITSGGMLGLIGGYGPYNWIRYNQDGSTQQTSISYEENSTSGPVLPTDESGNILIDISPNMVNEGSASIPRSFRGEEVTQIIEQMAEEQEIDILGIQPTKTTSTKLGTITGYRIGDRQRTVVFGAASENDNADLQYLPYVNNIRGTLSYDGVITNIEVRGGAITQGFTEALVPAWPQQYNSTVLNNPDLVDLFPGVYGMVGRAYVVPLASPLQGVIPFTDVPSIRAGVIGLQSGELDPAGNTDNATVWEHRPSEGDVDDDSAWAECSDPFIFAKYNRDMPQMRRLNIDGVSNLDWQLHNYALVIFAEPQIVENFTLVGDAKVVGRTFKSVELQAMRFLGNMIYRTGHRGLYPRRRTRYIDAPQWRKQIPYAGTRYKPGSAGRTPNLNSNYFDNTGSMTPEADRAAKNLSKGRSSLLMEIDGIDKSWLYGDTITTIIDTDGRVVEDQLDWATRGWDWMLGNQGEAVVTALSLDNETRY